MKATLTLLSLLATFAWADGQQFAARPFNLPTLTRAVPKPQVPRDLLSYFDLEGSARQFVDGLIGPRPGGLVPEKSFAVAGSDAGRPLQLPHQFGGGGGLAPAPAGLPAPPQLPPGFGQGFSLTGGARGAPLVLPNINPRPQVSQRAQTPAKASSSSSSIRGIPNVFPQLPKAPIPSPLTAQGLPDIPQLPTRPQVPDGGLGILAANAAPPSAGFAPRQPVQPLLPDYGRLAAAARKASKTGDKTDLFAALLKVFGLKKPTGESPGVGSLDINKALGALLNRGGGGGVVNDGSNGGVLSNVLYSALTDGAIQKRTNESNQTNNDAKAAVGDKNKGSAGGLTFSKEQLAALGSNVALIQQLMSQPGSPLCNPPPKPVTTMDVDAFMGTWYQVLYSPPLSSGPCSMVSYRKLTDVANGGPGTVFDTFEYTTDATPYARPKISSGYAIVAGPGELIYRTTTSPADVSVNVLETGPLNERGQYEYAVLSVNCNYPLHVFARDPVAYKQRYEGVVNAQLERRGLVNGFSRLLNIVAPVDSTLCLFPPTLFNIHG